MNKRTKRKKKYIGFTCSICNKPVNLENSYRYIQSVPGPGDDCASISRCCKECGKQYRVPEYKERV